MDTSGVSVEMRIGPTTTVSVKIFFGSTPIVQAKKNDERGGEV